MGLLSTITNRIFADEIKRQVFSVLAETDNTFIVGQRAGDSERDRLPYDRQTVLKDSLDAWRVNPLARRIVGLTSQYVVGNGITVSCTHKATDKFLKEFWNHPLNRLQIRCTDLCDELTRTGNLFIMLSTDAAGMSYIRAYPADQVKDINTRENDIETPLSFDLIKNEQLEPQTIPAYNAETDIGAGTVMLHYPINRPSGASWGESDLAPSLRWLSRYANWLEDRARLNHYRNSFLYVVHGTYTSDAARIARQNQLNTTPPSPGSILVADVNEIWEVLSAKLESSDANEDGLALKRMIASGSALPMHFLAEPEGSTRTTAEASGGPTYRHFEQRQRFFLWVMEDILRAVIARRARVDRRVRTDADFEVIPADISGRDNVAYSMAALNIAGPLKDLRDRKMIDDVEYLRLIYRFMSEPVDTAEMLERGKTAPDPILKGESEPIKPNAEPNTPGKGESTPKQSMKLDPDSGEANEKVESNQ